MRRIKAIFAALAVMMVMAANAAPAMADEWWEDCELRYNWFWNVYFLDCGEDPGWGWDTGWGGQGWGDDDGHDDNNGWGDLVGH